MERPVMNPMYLPENEGGPVKRKSLIRRAFGLLWGLVRLITRAFTADVFFWRNRQQLRIEDGSLPFRIVRGLCYRLLFAPVLGLMLVAALVYAGTHPPRLAGYADPLSHGTYYDPVSFATDDGTRLEGWLVPMVDAKAVIEHKESILKKQHPAVILVHDHGTSRVQMLPLVQPLHQAGYVVLVVGLRSSTARMVPVGSTFGLRESSDLVSAVEMLSRRAGVDPKKIGVLGIGTGANAALLAMKKDPRIAALVLDHPIVDFNEMSARRIVPQRKGFGWIRPACKWVFELAYRVDADELDLAQHHELLERQNVLVMGENAATCFESKGLEQIKLFLSKHLAGAEATAGSGMN